MKIEKFQLFEDREKVTLTTYIQEDSDEILKGGRRPLVLVCPGGAYMFCSDREAEPVALRFAAMGYHAAVLRYSVYSNSGIDFPNPRKSPAYEKSVVPGPMREIGSAILKIREHADEWLVDMDRIILTGYSAGANNCALYCVNWDKPVITDYLGVDREMIRPAAAVLGYGVYDYPAMEKSLKKIGDKGRISANEGFYLAALGTPEPSASDKIAGSPAYHVSENTPPMFLWTTRQDNVVPVQQTIIMANALTEYDIPFEMHVFSRGMHGLSLASQATSQAKEQNMAEIAQWPAMAQRWLEEMFPFDVPDVCPVWVMPED